MLGALGAGYAGVQVAVVLEEDQMTLGLISKVMSGTGLATLRADVKAATLCFDIEIQAVGRHGSIQVLVFEKPRRFQAKAECQNLGAINVMSPVVVETLSWLNSGYEFHTNDEELFKNYINIFIISINS